MKFHYLHCVKLKCYWGDWYHLPALLLRFYLKWIMVNLSNYSRTVEISKWQFWGFWMYFIWFHVKSDRQKNFSNFHTFPNFTPFFRYLGIKKLEEEACKMSENEDSKGKLSSKVKFSLVILTIFEFPAKK